DRYAAGLEEGQLVARAEVIGYVGTTGNASPNTPHLHFAIFKLGDDKRWRHGRALDPYLLFRRETDVSVAFAGPEKWDLSVQAKCMASSVTAQTAEDAMPAIDSLRTLLIEQLKGIYDAEKRLTKAIPKLIKNATNDELKSALREHLEQTEEHVARVEHAFDEL